MIPKQGPVIAIDGPAGTGKSTSTQRLAAALGFVHVDTGALYRAIALLCLENGVFDASTREIPPKAAAEAESLAHSTHLEFKFDAARAPSNRVLANGRDVTDQIRTPEISMAASRVSAVPGVRAALLGLQRRLGCVGRTILEGRDIGTVIFPDADVKFFLTASVDARTTRRARELEAKKLPPLPVEDLRRQIIERDAGDSSRAVAPLKKADDAIEIDTTELTLDEVVETMETQVLRRLKAPTARGARA